MKFYENPSSVSKTVPGGRPHEQMDRQTDIY
jgi:hypothetical protein